MKIHIDLEVSQEEIPFVTELVSLLRQLKTTTTTISQQTQTTTQPSTLTSSPSSVVVPTQQQHPTIVPIPSQPPEKEQAPQQEPTTQTQQQIPSSQPSTTNVSAITAATVIAAAPISASKQYRKLLNVAGEGNEEEPNDSANQTQIVNEIKKVMEQSTVGGGGADEAVDEFFAEFSEVVFSTERVQRNQSILPYVSLLPRLPEPYKTKVRDRLIQKVLKHLTLKRPIEANRMDFFAYAEAFAALVKVEFVNISGAITTITTLLQKPDSRCAAVTMLGKTVELCLHLLNDKCDVAKLAELRSVLSTINEEAFRYDVNYIEENMGWTTPLPLSALNSSFDPIATRKVLTTSTNQQQTTANPPPQPPNVNTVVVAPVSATPIGRLVAKARYQGHTDKIFTLCYDSAHESLISSGRDGLVISWGSDGRLKDHVSIPGQYACSMDVNPRTRSLFLCGVPKEQTSMVLPSLMLYSLNETNNWNLIGSLGSKISGQTQGLPPSRIISCVECMVQDQGNRFATGESLAGEPSGYIRFYDAESGSFDSLQPVVSYHEHEDFITSLANTTTEGMLFSGSRDGSIRLWDQRQPRSVALVGLGQSTSGSAKKSPQDGMITCIHASGCLLASGSLDCHVRLWDLRSLSQPSFNITVDETPVLKVAIAPQSTSSYPILAVSTNNKNGLYLSFPAVGQTVPANNTLIDSTNQQQINAACFYDLVWGDRDDSGNTVLYAAGEDLRKYLTAWD